jgi:hypothetical protein
MPYNFAFQIVLQAHKNGKGSMKVNQWDEWLKDKQFMEKKVGEIK